MFFESDEFPNMNNGNNSDTDKDYYKILGVDEKSSEDEIKKAYRKLSMLHHPDKNGNTEESKLMFQDLNNAYSTLSDPQKRRMYDMMRKGGGSGGIPPNVFHFGGGVPGGGGGGFPPGIPEELLHMLFGGGAQGGGGFNIHQQGGGGPGRCRWSNGACPVTRTTSRRSRGAIDSG